MFQINSNNFSYEYGAQNFPSFIEGDTGLRVLHLIDKPFYTNYNLWQGWKIVLREWICPFINYLFFCI